MFLIFLVAFGLAGSTMAILEGDHVCSEEQRYMVNTTRLVPQKIKIRNYKWCLNMPPRCSYYTDEVRYVPVVMEKEQTRTVNKCCPGFLEDKLKEKCISKCPNCGHGECDSNNKCNCRPGFRGEYCEKECQASKWGKNCENNCICKNGDCNPVTGYCNCPPGWKGIRCDEQLATTIDADLNRPDINQSASEIATVKNVADLEQRLTKYSDRTKYPTFQKYYTFYESTEKSSIESEARLEPDKLNYVEIGPVTEVYAILSTTSYGSTRSTTATQFSKNELKEVTNYINLKSYTGIRQKTENSPAQPNAEVDGIPVPIAHVTTTKKTKQEPNFVNNNVTDQIPSVVQYDQTNKKAKVVNNLEVTVTSSTTDFSLEDAWVNDESRLGLEQNSSKHYNRSFINDSHLLFSVAAVAGVLATTILVVVVAIFSTQSYRKSKPTSVVAISTKAKTEKTDETGPAVSIFTRSIFHAPLPEPPVFQNPVFATSVENESGQGDFGPTLETHVICSMHIPNHSSFRKDSRLIDAFYDHPPSTGSYRAASIPEPPDQIIGVINNESKEHLYDEIPCKEILPITYSTSSLPDEPFSYYSNATFNNNMHK